MSSVITINHKNNENRQPVLSPVSKNAFNKMNKDNRITYNPQQCGGKPCIRGMRIRVSDILQMLAEGVSSEEILQDFPDLELQDIQACLFYAARRVDLERLAA